MITLYIDTSSNKEIKVGLKINKKEDWMVYPIDNKKAQVVLLMIDKLIKKHNLSLKNIQAVRVNTGPGSFTGLRVGISVANALGFALKIPVNSKKAGEIVEPQYS